MPGTKVKCCKFGNSFKVLNIVDLPLPCIPDTATFNYDPPY